MSQAQRLEAIERACHELLTQHSTGISEYALLKWLREEEYALFPRLEPGDHLGLFQSHFLLFHALYRLRDRLHASQQGELRISALLIELRDYRGGEAALCRSDPIRDYYLDLNNLDETGEADVLELLNAYWRRAQSSKPGEVKAALKVLGLEQADDFDKVKCHYRRLVMDHHPDRGGEAETMQALNEALEVVRIHFRSR